MLEFIDRHQLIATTWEMLLRGLLTPESNLAFVVRLFTVLSLTTIALTQVHLISRQGNNSLLLGFASTLLGGFVFVEVAAFTSIFIFPLLENDNMRALVLWIILSATFMAGVVPFTRMVFKAPYWTSMGAWIVAALVGGLALLAFKLLGAGLL